MKNVIMSLSKKNVIQGFLQDDYVPTSEQQIVKYVQGVGNNLHTVECPNGDSFLVSMPKKYRQMVWLRKGDCIVIDPVVEGNKVRGEINCRIPAHWIQEMINTSQWPQRQPSENPEDEIIKNEEITKLKAFFRHDTKKQGIEVSDSENDMWPSSGDDETSEEEEEEEEEEENDSNQSGEKEDKESKVKDDGDAEKDGLNGNDSKHNL